MSWEELHRIQELESKVRKLEDRLAALEAHQVVTVRVPIEANQPYPITVRSNRNDV